MSFHDGYSIRNLFNAWCCQLWIDDSILSLIRGQEVDREYGPTHIFATVLGWLQAVITWAHFALRQHHDLPFLPIVQMIVAR